MDQPPTNFSTTPTTNYLLPSPNTPTTLSTSAFTTTTSPHHLLNHISPNKPTQHRLIFVSETTPSLHQATASPHRIASMPRDAGVPLPRRISHFNHVRFGHATPGIRIRIVKRAEPVGVRGERAEVKPRLSGPIKSVRSAKRRQSGEVREPSGSLKPGEHSRGRSQGERRRRELGARLSLLCRAELRARVWDVEGAGENSPASAKRSELIGP